MSNDMIQESKAVPEKVIMKRVGVSRGIK
jgi:hypothetical protein